MTSLTKRALSERLSVWLRALRGKARGRTMAQQFTIIHEDNVCAIYVDNQAGSTCLVAFTGIGHGTGGIGVQRPEFVKAGLEGPRIFVLDKTRSWGNALDIDKICGMIHPYAQGRRLVTLGNSMGGFLAILFSGPLGATNCLTFSPQWSVDPAIIPSEDRWLAYRAKIRIFHYPDLSDSFGPSCRYDIVFGDGALELRHAERFPADHPNLSLFHVQGADHNVAAALKNAGALNEAVVASLTGQPLQALLKTSGFAVKTSN